MKGNLLRFLFVGLIFPLAAGAAGVPPLTGAGCEGFGFDFYRKLSATEPYQFTSGKNVAISPLSLASVLQVFRLGASGKAGEELAQALDFKGRLAGELAEVVQPGDVNSKSVQFSVGNSLWVDQRFELKPGFVKAAKAQFDAAVFAADFREQVVREAGRINDWISQQTAGHIIDLVQPHSLKGAVMAVANAVYFKAAWESPFAVAQTKEEAFHLASGEAVQVPMMHKVEQCRYAEKDGVTVLELPYAGRELSMVLLLPKPGVEGWAELEASLKRVNWFGERMGALESRSVTIKLPRWTISCEPPDCIGVLQSMGIKQLFQPSWDFAQISDQGPLAVTAFMHRTWMEVNEKGTEAAAATVGVMTRSAVPIPPKTALFIADRPFLFVIRHNATGTPLFVGRVSNPAAK